MRRFVLPALVAMLSLTAAAAEPDGAKLYKLKCASCHGAQGEGAKKYPKPLAGDRSAAQLAKLIVETMPENSPGSLSDAEASAVAAYIHDAFYSPVARERNRPARIELARLTVRQYRQAVADVVGSFRQPMRWDDKPGLKGQYFAGRRMGGAAALERIDPQVDFDFKTDTPAPGKIEAHEFSVRWSGSLLAPETGEYDFVVRTDHAARLWVNDQLRPLIDAWVKSGKDTEFRGSLYLVGGRVYPLRLEFSKAKQGVDDSKKQKQKPPPKPAFVALEWKRPGRVVESIPARQLSPSGAPETYVCAVPFPPDDRSYGWERGTNVSKEWDAATTDAALDAAGYIAAHIDELAGVRPADRGPRPNSGNPASINLDAPADPKPASDRDKKLRAFARTFAERAWRRPLSSEQQALIERRFAAGKDAEAAIKRIVLLVLKSPRFLYREVNDDLSGGRQPPDDSKNQRADAPRSEGKNQGADAPRSGRQNYDVAARLSFGLWDSIPDAELIAAAASGQLATREQVAKQAERMLANPRAKAKLRDALLTWTKANHGLDLAKDQKKFPGFEPEVIADLRTSLELFLDSVVWSEKSDFRQLLLAEELPLNGRLAKFYGVDLPEKSDFTKVKLDAGRRGGVLTHPYLLASFAYSGESSPIHRGVFLARGVMGLSLRPPPEAVAPLAPELHPKLTTRERVVTQTKANACMTCHGIINPLGFTLERFDAVGRYREKDRNKPIDATGSYQTRGGKDMTLTGARELAAFVAGSEEAHEAFVEQMFHYLVQQPARAYGAATLAELRRSFAASGFNMRKLVVEIMAATALKGRGLSEAASRRP